MQIVNINLVPSGVKPIVYASQHDNGRTIRFALHDGNDTYVLNVDETVHAEITKPDGTALNIPMTNNQTIYSDLTLSYDDCDQEGIYIGEVVITDIFERVIGSLNFILKVEADPYGDDVTTDTASGNPCTFETDIADTLVSLTANITASGGGGTPSTPIPLVGHSELNLTRCGINLFDDTCLGYYTDEILLPAGTYYFKGFITTTGTDQQNTRFYWLDDTNTWQIITASGQFDNGAITWTGSAFGWESGTFYATVTLTKPETFRMSCSNTTANTRRVGIFLTNVDTFTPYNGQTFTVSFGQTVYGGVYDANRGKLVVTKGYIDLSTFDPATLGSTPVFYKQLSNVKVPASNSDIAEVISECYTPIRYNGVAGTVDTIAINTGGYIYVNTGSALTIPSGIAVFTLATPIEIDVSELSVDTIVGTNNIVSDCGGDVEVTYIKKV